MRRPLSYLRTRRNAARRATWWRLLRRGAAACALLLGATLPVAGQVQPGDTVRVWMGPSGIHQGLFRRTDSTGLSLLTPAAHDTITFPFEGMQRSELYLGTYRRGSRSFVNGVLLGAGVGVAFVLLVSSGSHHCQAPCEELPITRWQAAQVVGAVGGLVGGIIGAVRAESRLERWVPFDPRTLVRLPEP